MARQRDRAPQRRTAPRGSGAPFDLNRALRALLVVIPIGVLGNLAFTFLTTDRGTLLDIGAFPRGYLLLAVVLGLVPWVTNSLRLQIWTRFLRHRLHFRDAFTITLAVDLGSAISPTAVGGGFLKWGMLVQRGVRPGRAASLTLLPQIEDGIFFLIALPTAIWWSRSWDLPIFRLLGRHVREDTIVVFGIAGTLAIITTALVQLLLRGGFGQRPRRRFIWRIGRTRRRLRRTFRDARNVFRLIARRGKRWLALTLSLTAIQWAARYSVISAFAAFLGAPVDPVLFWVFQWVVFTLMSLIPTPGAAGGAEAAFYFIYSSFLPARVIGLATTGWRFLTFYLQLSLAAVLFTVLYLRGSGVPREARA